MVTTDLRKAYICDMGMSKLRQATQATVTTVTNPAGTTPYMAPEMFQAGHQGKPVDVYALGCLYIELFGQKRVWRDLDGMQIMQKVCVQQPPQMPSSSHLKPVYQELSNDACNGWTQLWFQLATGIAMLDLCK